MGMVSILKLATNNGTPESPGNNLLFGLQLLITSGLLWKHSFGKLCVFDFQMNDIIRLISEFQQSKYGKVFYKLIFILLKFVIKKEGLIESSLLDLNY